jgi:hypothetical protein
MHGALVPYESMYDAVHVRSYRAVPCTTVRCGVVQSYNKVISTVRHCITHCTVLCGAVMPYGDRYGAVYSALYDNAWQTYTV